MLAWLFVWNDVQICIWPSWCHWHSLSPASVKSGLVLPFWYWLTWVVPDKGPLNGCVLTYLRALLSFEVCFLILPLVAERSWGRSGLQSRRRSSLRRLTSHTVTGTARVIVGRCACTRATASTSSCSDVWSSCGVSSTNWSLRPLTSSCTSRRTWSFLTIRRSTTSL